MKERLCVEIDMEMIRDERLCDAGRIAYAVISLYYQLKDRGPTLRSLARLLCVSRVTARYRVRQLIRRRLVRARPAGYIPGGKGIRRCAYRYEPLPYPPPTPARSKGSRRAKRE